jgi:type II secretory pathway pseudopilin PulG
VRLIKTKRATPNKQLRSESGRSITETLIVVVITALLSAVAIPQLLSARRLMRFNSMPRELAAQMRFARQQAMSQRQAVTFQYDDSTKTVKILDHNNTNNANTACNMSGQAVLSMSGFPNTACTTTSLTIPIAVGAGLPASEITYGIPSGITATTLDDGNTMSALSSSIINITFQSNGTVTDSSGNFLRPTMFFYNPQAPTSTATAISVLGAAGRIKIWRYSPGVSKFTE